MDYQNSLENASYLNKLLDALELLLHTVVLPNAIMLGPTC